MRTRTDAAKLVAGGRVRLNSVRADAPGHPVRSGDVITVALDRSVRILKIKGFADRRGPSDTARTLYDDLSPPPAPRRPPPHGKRDPGTGRPTKRERRAIEQLIWGPGDARDKEG